MDEIMKDELDKMIEKLLNDLGFDDDNNDYQDAIDIAMEAEIKYFVH